MFKPEGKTHPCARTRHTIFVLDDTLNDEDLLAAGVIVIGNVKIGDHAVDPGANARFRWVFQGNFYGASSAPGFKVLGNGCIDGKRCAVRAAALPAPKKDDAAGAGVNMDIGPGRHTMIGVFAYFRDPIRYASIDDKYLGPFLQRLPAKGCARVHFIKAAFPGQASLGHPLQGLTKNAIDFGGIPCHVVGGNDNELCQIGIYGWTSIMNILSQVYASKWFVCLSGSDFGRKADSIDMGLQRPRRAYTKDQ